MSSPLDGLASGLSTTALINQLIQLERAPQLRLIQKKSKSDSIVKAIQGINAKLSQLRTASDVMARSDRWGAMKAASNAANVVTAAASTSALAGSLEFTVGNVATSGSLASTGTVSTSAAVISSGTLLLAVGGKPLGIGGVAAGAGLGLGEHEVVVTLASAGATKAATAAPLAPSTVITGANDELNLSVNGVGTTITLDAGTYTAAELAAEVQGKSGGLLTATLDGTDHLVLTTVAEGSAASIQITGGDALADLGLTVDGAAITGADGEIEVNGIAATVTDARAGAAQAVLSDDGGQIDITFSGGLRGGSMTTTAISTGTGSLAATASAVNSAKKGIAAAVVQVAPGSFRLQLSATSTGIANDLSIASDAFTGIGTLASTSVATDATLTIGSGVGAYSVTSSSNTVSDLLPGVTLALKAAGAATVTVDRDADFIADSVKGLIDLANNVLVDIKSATGFNATTGTAGLLMGTLAVRSLQSRILESVVSAVGTSTIGSASLAGVSTKKDGTLAFDRAKFLEAFANDPDAVAALFKQGGTSTDADVTFVSASNRTLEGTYDVEITTVAEQAAVTGLTAPASELIALAETIDVRVGTKEISYSAQAGESLTSIADGLNALLAGAALNVVATVENGRLVLRTTAYGSSTTFDVRSTASDEDPDQTGIVDVAGVWEAHSGVDVDGTINGVAASGVGQLLTAPAADGDLAGMVLRVAATAVGAQGTFTYVKGVAQRFSSVADAAIDTVTGTLTALVEGRTTEMKRFDEQILRWETRIEMREKQLRKQFTAMEIALQRSTGQQQWLAAQINSMQAINGRR